jgi:uridine phosphorylase
MVERDDRRGSWRLLSLVACRERCPRGAASGADGGGMDGATAWETATRELVAGAVPGVCLLDPDGDLVRHLKRQGRARKSDVWACYHTDLWVVDLPWGAVGVVGCAIGAPFAVLVAEQFFASGCHLLVSLTSAGQIDPDLDPPALILIDRACRGEGTSHAYLPPAPAVEADPALVATFEDGLARAGIPSRRGSVWTTDAPFRETASFIAHARAAGALAVEMEAAALYAFAAARARPVICFALVTNQMAQIDGDFEKGPAAGAEQALALVDAVGRAWRTASEEAGS